MLLISLRSSLGSFEEVLVSLSVELSFQFKDLEKIGLMIINTLASTHNLTLSKALFMGLCFLKVYVVENRHHL